MKRVVVAMSGGVDSSVAAALLLEEGYEVIGISMQLYDNSGDTSYGSCCSIEDLYDARRVADTLGIPHYVLNLEEEFSRHVVDYFVDSYRRGETPNPCLKCNEVLKFRVLLRRALELEADFLATGHYARIVKDGEVFRLLKGVDRRKDQSYFLFTLTQDELKRLLFPLGWLEKGRVREIAKEKGLKVAHKRDSQEICFIPDGDYQSYLESRLGPSGGEIVDTSGRVVGNHRGVYRYTVGQRRGIGVAAGYPLYVVGVEGSRVIVGREEDLYSEGLVAEGANILDPSARFPMRAVCKIRYRHGGVPSWIDKKGDRLYILFDEPQKAITPGQAAVLYRGEEVIGGGWIRGPWKG